MKPIFNLIITALLFITAPSVASPIYVQLSEPMTLKMSDGEEYVVRAAAHLMTSRTKTHLIVNDQTVDRKVRAQNSRFRLDYTDQGMELVARCSLTDSKRTGDVNDAYFDAVSMKRNLSVVERGFMAPMSCEIKVNGQKAGDLVLDKLVKLETEE